MSSKVESSSGMWMYHVVMKEREQAQGIHIVGDRASSMKERVDPAVHGIMSAILKASLRRKGSLVCLAVTLIE